MSSTNLKNFLDPLYAFITIRDRAALEIIKALYSPSFISTIRHYLKLNRREAGIIFYLALEQWWDNPSKPILPDQRSIASDIFRQVVHIISPDEVSQAEGLCYPRESRVFHGLCDLFDCVLIGRMNSAGKCAELHEDSVFDITAFHLKAPEVDEMLQEAFWFPIMVYCDDKINDARMSIKIANSVLDELDRKRSSFRTLAAIKAHLYMTAEELCQWCLSEEKDKW